jgi:hypothetical protein
MDSFDERKTETKAIFLLLSGTLEANTLPPHHSLLSHPPTPQYPTRPGP